MNSIFKLSFLFLILLSIFISIFYIPIIIKNPSISTNINIIPYYSENYLWPIPDSHTITSYFGRRNSPTSKASSYHLGVDIAAPQDTKLIAIDNGKVIFTGFKGSGGYTITYEINGLTVTYCHVSPNYIIKTGDIIYKGQHIGFVGPKNVYGIVNNPYKDSNRKSNKWCNNRFSFAFYNKKRRHSRQSIRLLLLKNFTYRHHHIHLILLVRILYYYLHSNLMNNQHILLYMSLHHSNLALLYYNIQGILLLFLLHQ